MSISSLKSYSALLKTKGIKPSFQRVKIMEFLQNNHIHPSVNDIYFALIKEIPSLSKTTVYNTLNLMKECSLVKILNIDETEAHYDINTHPHGHFMCTKCGEICDIDTKLDEGSCNLLDGYIVEQIEITVFGICPKCIHRSSSN